jgi:drug/metabolite transporter (DMT)-like permease
MTRGAAPLIVAMASGMVIGERLSPAAWGGVLLISCGIFGLALAVHRGGGKRGVWLPLANAFVIASYTIVDGLGVRRSGSPWGYTLWLDVLPAIPLVSWAMARRREAFLRHASTRLGIGLIGGAGSLLSYGLALWAMTLAPVALVAALRESSMLFATAISAFILREPVGRGRVAMVCFVVAGVAVLRLA